MLLTRAIFEKVKCPDPPSRNVLPKTAPSASRDPTLTIHECHQSGPEPHNCSEYTVTACNPPLAGKTSATSVQNSTGDGQQTNQGEAGAVSVQKQTGLGGATQTTINQGDIKSLQRSEGGGGGGQQSSDNKVTINSSQLQQNVNGTLVNVQGGHQGVVIINTSDESGAIGECSVRVTTDSTHLAHHPRLLPTNSRTVLPGSETGGDQRPTDRRPDPGERQLPLPVPPSAPRHPLLLRRR